MKNQQDSKLETITLAGGCFWCTEAVFKRVRGVTEVQSGYANGDVADPSYEQVCSGHTGHAEAVRVTFDPAEIGLRDILQIFFATHDPTTPNRQGNDVARSTAAASTTATPRTSRLPRCCCTSCSRSRLSAPPSSPSCSHW